MAKVSDPCAECGLNKNAGKHWGSGEGVHDHVSTVDRRTFGQVKKAIPARSKKTADYYREERVPAVREAVGDGKNPCQIQIPDVCTGFVEGIHETHSRGRFGGLKSALAAGAVLPSCHACNGWCSEHPKEAQEMGFMASNTLDGKRHTPRGPVPRSRFD
jgi:hypothetical protein